MKLKDRYIQPSVLGLPESPIEWWDLEDGYEISISIGKDSCGIGVDAPNKKDITMEVAKLLNVDTGTEKLTQRNRDKEEFYLSLGIDCVVLNYRKPEKYKELLLKIEEIVNKYIKVKKK